MGWYRRIPTRIEAVQWTGDNAREVRQFAGDAVEFHGTEVHIVTVHGDYAIARPGDWIMPESSRPDRFYPCADDVFQATYQPVPGPDELGPEAQLRR